jgi:predicted ATPase
VRLDDATVRSVVTRLDGLPLAIELAAAKVRAMSVEEVDRRLEDRFALLRGGDRSAPDRHRTLLAVIDWSWNLLDEPERRALRRLSLFNDGFTLEAAAELLGDAALEAVQGLVDQSLLSLRESGDGLRYRMLETVREFGLVQLADAGEDGDARAARRRWAVGYARRHAGGLVGPDQFATVDAVAVEETNLTDELRDAIADGDVAALVELLATLGLLWTIRGEHGRMLALIGAVADAVAGWTPPAELEDATRAALAVALTNAMLILDERSTPIRQLLARLGPGDGDPRIAGMVRVLVGDDPLDERIERLAHDPDPFVARTASQSLSHVRENAGDPAGAAEAAERALTLTPADEGPWSTAMLHNQLAGLTMHLGDPETAVQHARAALPVMERIGAKDDVVQLRAGLALAAIADGRLEEAEAELQRVAEVDDGEVFGGLAIRKVGAAELAIARGDPAAGLRLYRDCAATMRDLRFPGVPPTGTEPWTVFGESIALVAHAHHATGADEEHGAALFASCRERTLGLFDAADASLDCPIAGAALFALGSWGLLRDAVAVEDAVHLLALAERFAYNRSFPTAAWERIAPAAEQRAPGRIAALLSGYGDRRPRELVGDARDLVARLR